MSVNMMQCVINVKIYFKKILQRKNNKCIYTFKNNYLYNF